ncbi:hypothetical protein [Rhizobium lemnae]|nr:hypothetical protein [Rhizobium lemnae]
MAMTQVPSISAATAAYVMEATKPARRVATKDLVKDVKKDAETNDAKSAGANPPEKVIVLPPVPLKLDLSLAKNKDASWSVRDINRAYNDV